MSESELDIEELEAHLYNQVYHISSEDIEPSSSIAFDNNINNMRRSGRYFDSHSGNNLHDSFNTYSHTQGPSNIDQFNMPQARYLDLQNSRNLLNPVVANLPSLLINPVNNIVVLPSPTEIQFATNKQLRRTQQQLKKKKKRSVKRRRELVNNDKKWNKNISRVDVVLISDENDCAKDLPKATHTVILSSDDENETTIKTESKSNIVTNNDIKVIPTKQENKAKKYDDDVVFVELTAKTVEIIDLESDIEHNENLTSELSNINVNNDDVEVQPTDTSKLDCSSESDDKLKSSTPEKELPYEEQQKEMRVSTPESTASNDFLDSSVELSQNKFNFDLHGSDFNTKLLSRPMKQTTTEQYETESSTSDISTPMKTAVFSEIPFECTTKDIFTDTNLETFKNYITTKRSAANTTSSDMGSKAVEISSKHKKKAQAETSDSSGSSSESDYDESKVNAVAKCKKKTKAIVLPTLSTFSPNADSVGKASNNLDSEVANTSQIEDLSKEDEPSVITATLPEVFHHDSAADAVNLKRSFSEIEDSDVLETSTGMTRKKKTVQETAEAIEIQSDNGSVIDDNEDDSVCCVDFEGEDFIVISDSEMSIRDYKDFDDVGSNLDLANCKSSTPSSRGKPSGCLSNNKQQTFSNYWTEDKDKFYQQSWGNENLDTAKEQKSMSNNPKLWKIVEEDRLRNPFAPSVKGRRCNKCRQVGHKALRCPNKTKPLKCSLCGLPGHLEPRCPNKMCTLCGRSNLYSTTFCSKCVNLRRHRCGTCKMLGHREEYCPDLWRRYFLTTKEGPLVRPNGPDTKGKQQLYCSGCGRSGHLEHSCYYYNRTHPPINPKICKYKDVYESKKGNVQKPEVKPGTSKEQPLKKPEAKNEPVANNFNSAQQPQSQKHQTNQGGSGVPPTSNLPFAASLQTFQTPDLSSSLPAVYDSRKKNVPQVPAVKPNTSIEAHQKKPETKVQSVTNNYNFVQQFQQLQPQKYDNYQGSPSSVSAISAFPFPTTFQTFQNTQFPHLTSPPPILNPAICFVSPPPLNQNPQMLGKVEPDLNKRSNSVRGRSRSFESSMNFIALERQTANSGANNSTEAPWMDLQLPKGPSQLATYLQKGINLINNFCIAPEPMQSMLQLLKSTEQELHQMQKPHIRNMLLKRIGDMYQKLHIFLFGCYKIKDGRKHFEVLTMYAQILKSRLQQKNLPGEVEPHILAEIRQSYNYIFGNTCRNEDYNSLLTQVRSFSIKRKAIMLEDFRYFVARYNRKEPSHHKHAILFGLQKKINKFKCCNNDITRFREVFKQFKKMFNKGNVK